MEKYDELKKLMSAKNELESQRDLGNVNIIDRLYNFAVNEGLKMPPGIINAIEKQNELFVKISEINKQSNKILAEIKEGGWFSRIS